MALTRKQKIRRKRKDLERRHGLPISFRALSRAELQARKNKWS